MKHRPGSESTTAPAGYPAPTPDSTPARSPSMPSTPAWRARFQVGVAAVPVALAPGFLVCALFGVPTPLEPLAEWLMLVMPVGLASVLLTSLGTFARPLAMLGAIAMCLPIGGAIAALSEATANHLRLSRLSARGSVITGALALLVSLPLARSAAFAVEAWSALLCGALYAPAISLADAVIRRLGPRVESAASLGRISRRVVLGRAGISAVTVVGALALGSFDFWSGALAQLSGHALARRVFFSFHAPGPRQPGFPTAGVAPEVTPVEHFYKMSKNAVDPLIAPAGWSLRITGLVARPLSLSYADLLALPRTDAYVTLRCVDNPPNGRLMSTAYWSGVTFSTLLARAGLRTDAGALVMRASDGYNEVVPLSLAVSSHAMLAYAINGVSLPRAHGGPTRSLVPGLYGFKNVKWIEQIDVVPSVPQGYWAERGWTAGAVHSVARIDAWHAISEGILLGGVAFTGTRGVASVQVRADGGSWADAAVDTPALGMATWVLWRASLQLAPGKHRIAARVVDGDGQVQTDSVTGVYPAGTTGLDEIEVTI